MYGWGFQKHIKNINQSALIIQLTDCLPTIDKNISIKCLKKANLYYKSIIENKNLKNVIIGLNWYSNLLIDENGKVYDDFNTKQKSIEYLIDKLLDNKKNVYLLGPIEIPNKEFASELSRQIIFKGKKNLKFQRQDKI